MPTQLTTMLQELNIFADLRWPSHTGIGQVQRAYLDRKPVDITVIDLRVPGRIGHPLSSFRIAMSLIRAKGGVNLFCNFGFLPPLFGCQNAVVFLHDLIHLRYYGVARRLYYNFLLKRLYRKCAAIVCVSNHTKTEFLEWSGIDPEKVHVIPNGVAPRFVENKRSLNLPYKYILYPGNHRPYKNSIRLLDGFYKSALWQKNVHLVLTDHPPPDLEKKIRLLHLSDFVHFLGHVPDEQMPELYRGARAVAFISLYEGFGLPILEAMASAVPVITSRTSAMPEVAGDAAILVDPFSIQEISQALVEATTNEALRQEMIQKGTERIKYFDWDDSARIFWALARRHARTGL